jgi:hypothetical protein
MRKVVYYAQNRFPGDTKYEYGGYSCGFLCLEDAVNEIKKLQKENPDSDYRILVETTEVVYIPIGTIS